MLEEPAAHNNPFPNVIIEIAYKNRSSQMLPAKLQRWMSNDSSVQIAIGIKVFVGVIHVLVVNIAGGRYRLPGSFRKPKQ
ncbi:hypothetical protein P3T76_015233 [Phytophthora citrophthora]|uniref:Uncharacterized protein n=1 Tax=Phytophthora citrophthora TaxID=4793 RepID=A0AAD9FZM6_9STRA|nr:hypothetical protein P3T76_015233 [Phytophthora citrophthora]